MMDYFTLCILGLLALAVLVLVVIFVGGSLENRK